LRFVHAPPPTAPFPIAWQEPPRQAMMLAEHGSPTRPRRKDDDDTNG
jgi:hypothetical protein